MTIGTTKSNVSRKIFHLCYFIGFFITILIAKMNPEFMLYSSLSHMALLIFLAYTIMHDQRILTGTKIGLTGYMYTMLGVLFAFYSASRTEDGSIDQGILYSLVAQSLLTSVFGWLVGDHIKQLGEIELKPESSNGMTQVETRLKETLKFIEKFNSALNVSTSKLSVFAQFEDNVKSLQLSLDTINNSLQDTAASLSSSSSNLKKNLETISDELSSVRKMIKEGLSETVTSIKSVNSDIKSSLGSIKGTKSSSEELAKNMKSAADQVKQIEEIVIKLEKSVTALLEFATKLKNDSM